MPRRLVPNSGLTCWTENLSKDRLMISTVDRDCFLFASGYPPISFRISSVSQVVVLFLWAIPCTAATASSWRPRETRNLGDSYRVKRRKRHKNMAKVMAPSVRTRYLHPQLSALVQVAAVSQEKLGMKAQASILAIRVPTDHHVASPLRTLPELGGRHSKKTAASTGKFPPTPRPRQAYSAQVLHSASV